MSDPRRVATATFRDDPDEAVHHRRKCAGAAGGCDRVIDNDDHEGWWWLPATDRYHCPDHPPPGAQP